MPENFICRTESHFENPVQQPAADSRNASLPIPKETQKPLETVNSQGFMDRKDSGGGIRTPDTRIMIPLL
jgi:hypothetical protein